MRKIADVASTNGRHLSASCPFSAVTRISACAFPRLIEDEAGELIATTVKRWDPIATSRRIELAIGRDLQFIRINGTLVGGLAGMLLYLLGGLF